jgi:hypothetical protein
MFFQSFETWVKEKEVKEVTRRQMKVKVKEEMRDAVFLGEKDGQY